LILATPSGPNCTRVAKKGTPGTTCRWASKGTGCQP
jgi:hypothetical protein